MIIKTESVAQEASCGRKNLVLAGCHGVGTRAADRALEEGEILAQIWERAGDNNFQALIILETFSE